MKKLKRPAPLTIMSPARFAAFMTEPVKVEPVLSNKPARRVPAFTFDVELRVRLTEKEVVDRAPPVEAVNFTERYFQN